MRKDKITMHNYLKRILELQAEGRFPAGSVSSASIAHDDWCSVFKGKECNCDPDVVVTTRVGNRQSASNAKGTVK